MLSSERLIFILRDFWCAHEFKNRKKNISHDSLCLPYKRCLQLSCESKCLFYKTDAYSVREYPQSRGITTIPCSFFKFLLENKGTLCLGEGRQNEGQVGRWLLSVLLEAKITTWPDTSLESIWKTENRGSSGGTLTSTWTYLNEGQVGRWLLSALLEAKITTWPDTSLESIWKTENRGSSGGTLTSTWTYFYGNYSIFKSAIPGWLKLIIFIEAIEFFPGDSYVQILSLINSGGIRPVLGIGVHSLIPFWLRSMFPILGNWSQEKNVHKRRKDW